jgi:tetratricopeptide (TPR) repeat protein
MAGRSSPERPKKEKDFMMNGGKRMKRASGFTLIVAMAILTACASAPGAPGEAGQRPRDDADTRAASVALAQAALAEGPAARQHYERALASGLSAIERDPANPRAYLVAGQAAVGVEQWVQADTMFARAEELHPPFSDQIEAEREEGWVMAYNAGVEALNAGDRELALERFRGADLLYQRRPEARLMLGVLHTQQGNREAAIAAYRGAVDILGEGPPEGADEEQIDGWEDSRQAATFNLANLLAQAGRHGEAADILGEYLAHARGPAAEVQVQALSARAVFLAQAGRADEAEALYEELLARDDLGANEYLQIGIALFNADDFERSADAFGTSAQLNPHSRDAYLNLVQALYTAASQLEQEPQTAERDRRLNEMYDRLLAAADRVEEFDPLNRSLLSFTLRAYRAKADISPPAEAERLMRRSQEVFRAFQEQAYEVSDLSIEPVGDEGARIHGVLTNLSGTPGQQVGLRFTVLDANGNALDTGTAQVTVPAVEESAEFSVTVNVAPATMAGWRDEQVR